MNTYQEITDRVLRTIDEQGIVPWHQPWVGASDSWSHATGQRYSLLNSMLLPKHGEWGTFKQWKDSGASVKKGEKASLICFYTILMKDEGKLDKNGETELKPIPLLRHYAVFHSSQVEGDFKLKHTEIEITFDHPRMDEAEKVITDYAERNDIRLQFDPEASIAYYAVNSNYIQCPPLNKFREVPEYYATMFHEMTHSTMHALGRKYASLRGNRSGYAVEELVAEMGAAFLCGHFGILNKTIDNSAAYLRGWRDAIAKDNRLIVTAATAAEKAVKFILTGELPSHKTVTA